MSKVLPGPWRAPMYGAEWTNLNAFAARLHIMIDSLPYINLRGLLTLLDALEEYIPITALEYLVPSAACWILFAGFKLKTNEVGYPESGHDDGSKRVPLNIGDLYNEPGGFNVKRWLFWSERFSVLNDQEDLKEETKLYAERAWREMV